MSERPTAGATRTDLSQPLTSAERAKMPLVDLIMREALDEEYVDVARRRTSGTRTGRPGVFAAVAVLLFGVLVTISFQQTRSNEVVTDAGRATLEKGIRTRRVLVSRAQDRIVDLRAAVASAEAADEVLSENSAEVTRRVRRLEASTGFSALTGEGVRIVVGDAPDGLSKHRVYDEDLALLTNGLWEAGASAIAVDGQRITALSAFRFSGGTIRVNDANLIPPYTVEALGDRGTLQANLLDTTSGLTFQSRADEFGFMLSMQNEQRLSLPSAPQRLLDLRSATTAPLQEPDPRPGRSTS